jgi:hypothetical protein
VQAIDSYGDGTTMRKNFIRDASILVASNMRVVICLKELRGFTEEKKRRS